jgi:hypothetical protein
MDVMKEYTKYYRDQTGIELDELQKIKLEMDIKNARTPEQKSEAAVSEFDKKEAIKTQSAIKEENRKAAKAKADKRDADKKSGLAKIEETKGKMGDRVKDADGTSLSHYTNINDVKAEASKLLAQKLISKSEYDKIVSEARGLWKEREPKVQNKVKQAKIDKANKGKKKSSGGSSAAVAPPPRK